MAALTEAQREERIAAVVARAEQREAPGDLPLDTFSREYYRQVDLEDLDERTPEDLLGALLSVPFWHAPALVHWGGQGVAQALFSSTLALWRNKAAFALNGLLWFAAFMTMSGIVTLLFTALGSRFLTLNPGEPMPSLTAQIYQYTTGTNEQIRLAWAGVLVLIGLIFVLNLAIRFAASRRVKRR